MALLVDEVSFRLEVIRRALGYDTPAAFAEYLGVGRTRYINWEAAANMPAEETLVQLADRADITTDYVYRGRMDGIPEALRIRLQATAEVVAAERAERRNRPE